MIIQNVNCKYFDKYGICNHKEYRTNLKFDFFGKTLNFHFKQICFLSEINDPKNIVDCGLRESYIEKYKPVKRTGRFEYQDVLAGLKRFKKRFGKNV